MWKYNNVNPKQSFPELEKEIQKYWEENNTFKKSIENREGAEEFNFYDGPPFATGLPHYGHLLAGTIKDVIPRYRTMKWYKVERIFWWDCHGLPIENIVEKLLNISWRDDIENKVWIDKFNETCRENVLTYTNDWKKIVKRMWRWVDVDNPYIAMDKDFMEAVWWVFKKLYEKWLVYEWDRVVPYCPRCSTSLSNFEVAQAYKDKSDKTVTAKFKILDKNYSSNSQRFFLAWTTTPWTLVANVGLAVGADIKYVEVKDKSNNEQYILAKERLENYFKNKEDYEIVKEYVWSELVWIKYEPLLDMVDKNSENVNIWDNAYKIILGHHVTTASGTGIVHIAPSFGEDDFKIGEENKLGFISHIWNDWKTRSLTKEWNWKWVFDFNQEIIDYLKKENLLVKIESITHSYPHCWRCDTPLIYRWIPAWYVKVSSIKDDMISANKDVSWIPEHIWTWRFGKWLENARDWNISRNRYWATPIPVWQDEDKEHTLVVWTVEELYKYNKDFWQIEYKDWKYYYTKTWKEIDLHKHFVDDIKLKDPLSWKTLRRIPELLDVWFDSGSMPYALSRIIAKRKYNMSSKEFFDKMDKLINFVQKEGWKYDYKTANIEKELKEIFKFPANFIAEWQDQTRWWFYTLMIIGNALFKNTPYYNVIVNGIILAEDGKKMSKSLKNYPDPMDVVNNYWADAIRFYMMNSPAVQAQELKFSEKWVEETMRKVILPIWNTYYFFTTYANIDNWGEFQKNESENNRESKNNKFDDRSYDIIWLAMKVHNELWPWLQEKVYVNWLKKILEKKWYKVEQEKKIEYKIEWDTVSFWRIDLVINDKLAIEVKSRKNISWDFYKQLRTYINQSDTIETWLLFNFYNWKLDYKRLEKNYFNSQTFSENKLDIWIISELNQLIKNVDNAFKNYNILEATKSIVDFMDGLTNWYIRRSRRRFWKSENDNDKNQAYSTLYEVLTKLTQVLAPISPFISEYIYKDLTKKESVHLSDWPEYDENLIDENLNKEMKITQDIVWLWLSWRARNKIRTRQPLSFIKITEDLPKYYKEIIKEELNVKDVIISKELAKKIAKPEWRKIWPKYWKSVQDIIKNAKMWNFKELEDNKLKVFTDSWEFILEKDEYIVEFMPVDDNLDLESWFGIVVALDKNIDDKLLKEWYARDIVRFIQEWRKDANYNVADRISISINWDDLIEDVVKEFKKYIETETLSKIEYIQTPDLSKEIEIEDKKVIIKLKK